MTYNNNVHIDTEDHHRRPDETNSSAQTSTMKTNITYLIC